MQNSWPMITMVDVITNDTIREHRRPVVPRAGEIVSLHPELIRWRVSDVIHDGDSVDEVTVHLIPIFGLQEVPSGDNSGG